MTTPRPDQLSLFRRFHVRLGLLYGALVLVVLTGMAVMMYRSAVDAAKSGLQDQLRGVAVALAVTLPAGSIRAATEGGDAHRTLQATLTQVLADEPEIDGLYVLVPTASPGELAFAADVVRHGASALPGERYNALQAHHMMAGLERPTVESTPYTDDWGTFLSGYAPVRDPQGRGLGLVGVDIRIRRVQELERKILLLTLACYGLAVGALCVVGAGVGRYLRGPLERLIAATSAVDAGDLSARTGLRRDDEFGILGAHFDHMAEGLQERELIRDTFGRYVSREVAREILSGPSRLGGDLREVTVLFSDVRGYSTLSERLPPERVVAVMNTYFGAMSEEIEAQGGTVIEFLGDGILAVFGAPSPLPDHAARAVLAAEAMRARLHTLNRAWEADGVAALWRQLGLGRLGARIGVHTGVVVAGNLGSPRRMKYAVIGDTVNLASRVEGLNNTLGTDLLLTEATWSALPDALKARAVSCGVHPVKGRDHPVVVYTLPEPAST